jgi:hypothetical protein
MGSDFNSSVVAIPVALIGCVILVRAVVLARRWRRGLGRGAIGPESPLMLVRSIRALLAGGALVALGVGILHEPDWLVALALIIGAEELLETSVTAAALGEEVVRRGTV